MRIRTNPILIFAASFVCVTPAFSQDALPSGETQQDGKRIFQPDFFASFGPVSALDMVSRIPGFSIESSNDRRGFGDNAGNVLIDGERPSTKSDNISAVLSRIPASQVDRIELTEQAGADGEARGKGQVVNVIRKSSASLSGTYDVRVKNFEGRGPTLFGATSATLKRGATTYEINLDSYSQKERATGPERFFNGGHVLQERRQYLNRGSYSEASLGGAIKTRIGKAKINTNAKISWQDSFDVRNGAITSGAGALIGNDRLVASGPRDDFGYEVGADVEAPLAKSLSSKVIGLYRRNDQQSVSSFDDARFGRPFSRSESESDNRGTEAILRLQNDWGKIKDHAVQFGVEVAFNSLRSEFAARSSVGGLVTPFPPANVVVKEKRIEPFISDVWSVSPAWKLEGGLVAEASRLTLTGDSQARRSFTFWKPRAVATWTVNKETTLEFRAERQVAQLDFGDFATSVDFGAGGQVAAGNADLVPEKTTTFSALVRRKFFDRGSIQLRGSYVLVSDTQDLVPVTARDGAGNIVARFDGAGNIGSSRRWNGELEITLPFDWITKPIGVTGMEIKYVGQYHGSRVTDPVTGFARRRSNESLWTQSFEFTHDISKSGIAWGVSVFAEADRPSYFVNQFRAENNGADATAFVEYKKFKFGTIRFQLNGFLNKPFTRNRRFFNDTRASGQIIRFIERERYSGRAVVIALNGKF
jgi:outer membrane receptor protein involved in Fe transport